MCLTVILIFVLLISTGVFAGLDKFHGYDFNLYQWFFVDSKGWLSFIVIGAGVFFYFLCGALAGNVLEIEREDKDDYYRNMNIVQNDYDPDHVFLQEVGRIRKNTAKRHSTLKRIAREHGITLFVFRNIFQMIFVFGAIVLMALIIKTEAFNFVNDYKAIFKPKDLAMVGVFVTLTARIVIGVKWLLIILAFVFLYLALKYTFSRNEFKTVTMREDCRRKARILYKTMMLLTFFCILGWVVLVIVDGFLLKTGFLTADRFMYFKLIGLMLIVLMGLATDIVFNPRDPDQDVGVDFFSDDGAKRDPDDGPYVHK